MAHQNLKKKFITSEEINVLKDSILKLRSSFKPNHHLQYIVNTLEQGFFTIIDRVNTPLNLPTNQQQTTQLLQTIVSSPPGAASSTNIQQQQQQPGNKLNNNPGVNPSSASSSTSSTSSTSSKNDRHENTNPTTVGTHYSSTSALPISTYANQLRAQASQPALNTNYPQFSDFKRQQQNFLQGN
jgi:hypothetical protein